MAKSYDKIVSNFTKLIQQCEDRSSQLQIIQKNKEEESAALMTEANDAWREQQKVDLVADKIRDFLGM